MLNSENHKIVAVDFDGVLCSNDFPDIGYPNYLTISLVRQLIDDGHEVILWTTRNGAELEAAIKWCEDYGLHFTCINEPAPSNVKEFGDKYPTMSRKIYADVYIDDHNLEQITKTVDGRWGEPINKFLGGLLNG